MTFNLKLKINIYIILYKITIKTTINATEASTYLWIMDRSHTN